MRRDYFDVDVRQRDGGDDTDRPVVAINFDGPGGMLADRLVAEDDGATLDASEIDVTYRRKPSSDDREGVLSITNRVTGEFVLEVNVDRDEVDALVSAASVDGDDQTAYEIRLTDAEGKSTVYEKHTLLVYDAEGSLLRQESLIPGGVEL